MKIQNPLPLLDEDYLSKLNKTEVSLQFVEFEKSMSRRVNYKTDLVKVGGLVVDDNDHDPRVCLVECSTQTWRPITTHQTRLPSSRVISARGPFGQWRFMEALTDWLSRIEASPDLMFVMGDGISHGGRFGLACAVGVMLNIPTIGVIPLVMNSYRGIRTVSSPDKAIPPMARASSRGSHSTLHSDNQGPTLLCVKTQENRDPIGVSVGHMTDSEGAIKHTLMASPIHPFPSPIEAAIDHLPKN